MGPLDVPLFRGHPEFLISTTALVVVSSFGIGLMMATINIPAQTTIQEQAEENVRGRVFAVQFAIANALSIPPMLSIGFLADRYGIPQITWAIAVFIALSSIVNLLWVVFSGRLKPHSDDPTVSHIDS